MFCKVEKSIRIIINQEKSSQRYFCPLLLLDFDFYKGGIKAYFNLYHRMR